MRSRAAASGERPEDAALDQAVELAAQRLHLGPIGEAHADLEVALVGGVAEVGRGDQGLPVVDEGKCKPFAELSILNTDQLVFQDHAVAFAYVDFLITAHGGAKFRDLVRLCKQSEPQPTVPIRDALQAVYGWNPLTIDAPFQQWVKENYSPVESR